MAVRQALLWALTSRYSTAAITFFGSVALARLLSPVETGIYSVAAGLVALVQILRDFGIGSYIIRLPELEREQLENAFGLALAVSWTLGVALIAAAPMAAGAYGEPGLAPALRVLAINFFLVPLNLPTLAVLRRDMRFKTLFRIGLAGTITFVGLGVALAWAGLSYMSMVYASVAQTVVIAVAAGRSAGAAYVTRPRFNRWREVARFGGAVSLIRGLNEMAVEVAPLFIGRLIGLADAGLYSKANSTLKFAQRGLLDAVGAVALPAVAQWRREHRPLGPLYLRKIRYFAALQLPLHAVLAILAHPLVILLFGEAWLAIIPVVWVLAVSAVGLPWSTANSEFLLAHDRLRTEMRLQALNALARVVTIGLAAGLWRTLFAAALAMTLVRLLNAVQYQAALGQLLGVRWREAGLALGSSIPLVIGAVAGPAAVLAAFGPAASPVAASLRLLAAGPLALAGWCAAAELTRHPIREEIRWLVARSNEAARRLFHSVQR